MAKTPEGPKDGSPPEAVSKPLLWVDEWMDSLPFDAAWQESRTAFVRWIQRHAHLRRDAETWAKLWRDWLRQIP